MTMITSEGWMPIPEARRQVEQLKQELKEVDVEIQTTTGIYRELNHQVIGYLAIARRMGLPENVQASIRVLSSLRLAYLSLQAVRMATGDPLAWLTAGVTVGATVFSVANELDVRAPEY